MGDFIYLDYAATTYRKPESVYQAMEEANRCLAVNAGRGSYRLAQNASRLIEETRGQICRLARAEAVAEVVFTPSATIACNQVLGGLEWKKEDVVYVTPFEHNAVMRVLHYLQKKYGFVIEELGIDLETLELDLERIRHQFLRNAPSVLVMTHVSNVTGYVIPWREITKLAEVYQPIVVLDGSQALGLVPVKLQNTAVDFYIFAGHKTLYGPLGVGGYINNHGKKLKQILFGGNGSDSLNLEMAAGDVSGYEPGSMNITAIAGLHAALLECMKIPGGEGLRAEQRLRSYLIEGLQRIPEVVLYSPVEGLWRVPEEARCTSKERQQKVLEGLQQIPEEAVTGILSFNIEGYQAQDAGLLLDEDYNIAVRTGYHCAPLIHKYLKDESYAGTVRVSVGRFTTKEEIDRLIQAVEEIAAG